MGSQQKKLSTLFPPSRTALYCTFSAPFKSKDAYNPASNLYTNVVGYSTVTAKKDAWLLTAVQFEGVDGNDALLSDLIKGDYQAVEFDEDEQYLDTAPHVMIPSASGYSDFFYINFEDEDFWFDASAGGPDEGTPIAAGTGIWFKQSGNDCAVTFAGQVVSDSSVPVSATANTWNLISNPYPIAAAISGVTYTGIKSVEFDEDEKYLETAPHMMVPSADGYADFFYINFEDEDFWFDAGAGGPDEGATLPVGAGVWFKAATDVTITFTK